MAHYKLPARSLFDGKLVGGDGVVALAGLEDDGGEFRLIRRIGKVLGFQAEGVAARIGEAALAGSFAIEKISGVKLDAGLGGPNFQDAAGGGLDDARGAGFAAACGTAQDTAGPHAPSSSEFTCAVLSPLQ